MIPSYRSPTPAVQLRTNAFLIKPRKDWMTNPDWTKHRFTAATGENMARASMVYRKVKPKRTLVYGAMRLSWNSDA